VPGSVCGGCTNAGSIAQTIVIEEKGRIATCHARQAGSRQPTAGSRHTDIQPTRQPHRCHGAAAPDATVRHSTARSLRVAPGGHFPDAIIESAPFDLTIGRRYELSGWIRTENLTVRDTDRSPDCSDWRLALA